MIDQPIPAAFAFGLDAFNKEYRSLFRSSYRSDAGLDAVLHRATAANLTPGEAQALFEAPYSQEEFIPLIALAWNPLTPDDVLIALAESDEVYVLSMLSQHLYATGECIATTAASVERVVSQHEAATTDYLADIFRIRQRLLTHRNAPQSVISEYCGAKYNNRLRLAAASLVKDEKMHRSLLTDDVLNVALAKNPYVSSSILRRLYTYSGRTDFTMKEGVAGNPGTPPDILNEILRWAFEVEQSNPPWNGQIRQAAVERLLASNPSMMIDGLFALYEKHADVRVNLSRRQDEVAEWLRLGGREELVGMPLEWIVAALGVTVADVVAPSQVKA